VSEQQIVPRGLDSGLAAGDLRRGREADRLWKIKLMTLAHTIRIITKQQRHERSTRRVVEETHTTIPDGDDLTELLGRYEISFISGIGDWGKRISGKSWVEGKGRYGS